MLGTNNKSYEQNTIDLSNSITQLNDHYKFIYIKPDANYINETDINTCYAADEYTGKSLNFVPINNVIGGESILHTKSTCKLNAARIQKKFAARERDDVMNGAITKTPGLKFEMIQGYFANDITKFIGASIIAEGIANDFTDINTATNGKIKETTQFSIEWKGHFIPSVSGMWTFGVVCDDISLLWIGDNAVNDYTAANAFIANSGANTTIQQKQSSYFIANKMYPIRIQYGQNNNDYKFNLVLVSPDNKIQNAKDNGLFYTLTNADGRLYENKFTYYSLVENTPELSSKGYFDCYVNDPNEQNLGLKNKDNQQNTKIIWSAFGKQYFTTMADAEPFESIKEPFQEGWGRRRGGWGGWRRWQPPPKPRPPPPTVVQIYHPDILNLRRGNYLWLDNDMLSIRNDDGSNSNLGSTTTGKITIMDLTGILHIESSPDKWTAISSANNVNNNVQNISWAKYNIANSIKNTTIIPKNTKIGGDGKPILISSDEKYKLTFTPDGDLVIKAAINSCSGKDTNNAYKYSTAADNSIGKSFYPYRIESADLIDNLYLASTKDANKKTLAKIPLDGDMVTPTDKYINYSEMYPDNKTGANDIKDITQTGESCAKLCSDNANCKHYYEYTEDGKTKCAINQNSHLPNLFFKQQPTNNITQSTLYVRDYKMNFDKKDVRNILTKNIESDYSAYSDYELIYGTVTKNDANSGLSPELVSQIQTNKKYLGLETFSNNLLREGLDNNGYVSSNDFNKNVLQNTQFRGSVPAELNARKIDPLKLTAADYSLKLNSIDVNKRNLDTNTQNYIDLSNNNVYLAKDDKYIKNKKNKTVDVELDDVNAMIIKQNEIYLLGAVTAATLLIFAIYIARQ